MRFSSLFAPKVKEEFSGALETWVVKWRVAEPGMYEYSRWSAEEKYQAFTSKEEAEEFAKSLRICFETIRGNTDLITVYQDKE